MMTWCFRSVGPAVLAGFALFACGDSDPSADASSGAAGGPGAGGSPAGAGAAGGEGVGGQGGGIGGSSPVGGAGGTGGSVGNGGTGGSIGGAGGVGQSCPEIEAAYTALVSGSNQTCNDTTTCIILFGHCGVGLGGCWYTLNGNVTQADLDALAANWTALGCQGAVCKCIAPPASTICDQGMCAPGP